MSEPTDKRLGSLERDMARFGAELDGVKRDVTEIGAGVRTLLDRDRDAKVRDAEMRARNPYDVKDLLQMIMQGLLVVSLIVGGIIYIAGGQLAPQLAVMQHKINELYGRSGWSTTIRK